MYWQRGVRVENKKRKGLEDPEKILSDALKVNKLRDADLRVYFKGVKLSPSTKEEFARRSQHYKEFKKALNNNVDEPEEKDIASEERDAKMKELLKRYGVRKVERMQITTEYKPAMRRAPLKTIKTIPIQLPAAHMQDAIYMLPRRRDVEVTAKLSDVKAKDPKVSKETKDKSPQVDTLKMDSPASNVIEKQLQETKDEINIATTQLQKIKDLLNMRKLSLSPVREETEEYCEECEEYSAKNMLDKKCSAIEPRIQWTVKSVNTEPVTRDKNRLMSTLNHLNRRLQNIQEKYFNEPRLKYKSISDFVPPPRNKLSSVQTIYRNSQYAGKSNSPTNFNDDYNDKKDEELSKLLEMFPQCNDFDSLPSDTSEYLQKLVKTETKNSKPKRKEREAKRTKPIVEVLMSPKYDVYKESEMQFPAANAESDDAKSPTRESKSILKKRVQSEVSVLEAPALQKSIFKSNYLMKEFNLNPKDLDFDLSRILSKKEVGVGARKNVRFVQSALKETRRRSTEKTQKKTNSALDYAFKNSLFYPE